MRVEMNKISVSELLALLFITGIVFCSTSSLLCTGMVGGVAVLYWFGSHIYPSKKEN